MKKMVVKYFAITIITGITVNAYAMNTGFYLGLMAGPATNKGRSMQAQINPQLLTPPQNPNQVLTTIANPRSNQFGSRLYMGNQFNRYAAIEGGVTIYSTIRYDTRGVPAYGGTDQRVRTLDVMGKGIFPFGSSPLSIFAKAGVAVTYVTTGGALNPTFKPQVPAVVVPPAKPISKAVLSGSNTYRQKFSPVFAVGASYDINQSWQVEATFNSTQIGSNIGNVTSFMVGFTYHLTDKYCGQFLCDDD